MFGNKRLRGRYDYKEIRKQERWKVIKVLMEWVLTDTIEALFMNWDKS